MNIKVSYVASVLTANDPSRILATPLASSNENTAMLSLLPCSSRSEIDTR
jgi:hypothetical protein